MIDGSGAGRAVYWRLSNLYFWFFAALGALVPYWSLYLEGEGFSYLEIALLMATLQGTKIIAPNLWGWLGDRTGQRLRLVRLGAMASLLCFCGVFARPEFTGLMLVMLSFSFFWNAILPLYEVVTLHNLGADSRRYGRVRLWGSIGFIASVAGIGALLEFFPVSLLPWMVLPVFVGILLSTRGVHSEPRTRRQPHHGSIGNILRQPAVWSFFLVNFLLQVSHGPYYTFFSIHLETMGYGKFSVGGLWALGVIAEVGLFLVMHRFLGCFPMRTIALVAIALTALRWGVIAGFSDQLLILLLAQLLHAASYGALHGVSVHYIRNHFGEGHHGQGQALYSGLTFGAGGATGAWIAGLLVQGESTIAAFWGAALAMTLGLVIAWIWMRPTPDRAYAGD
ncbi:MAG: MFS transporter [Oleiphilaceae bacterium]|nr:MFS transporter [Oleiphilaceae bacterium]